ncbi:hypothetical protein NC653_010151 [Populus alba x Populus x berolinensis]|uniref:Uncharacterized protein n=1 Tax=Populus alba x Populus x berolinensis TaxID=444605 RepID=A0AAD6R0M1_9ROSI|nr:hypothetical protein NC653_010151 [Populus alba x Populus x berolinensis]
MHYELLTALCFIVSRSYGFAISISRRFLRSFGSFSGFGRCGDSSSLTSQSFRASHGKGTCFTGIDSRVFFQICMDTFLGIAYFLQNLLASFIKGAVSSLAYQRLSLPKIK